MRKNKKEEQPISQPLSDEELGFLKKSISSKKIDRSKLPHYDNSEKARLWRYAKENKIFTVICLCLAICIIALLSVCIVFAVKKASNRVNTDDYTITVGTESYTVKYKNAVRDGVLYIDMYKIAKYCGMTVTGTDDRVKYTASENNYLRFEDGSDTAVINGSMVDLGGTAVVSSKLCEIPYEFLNLALGKGNGLKLSLDSKTNTVKITRRMYEADDSEAILPVEIVFYTDPFDVIIAIQRPASGKKDEEFYDYSIDISAYLSSIEPENSDEYLLLANKQNPLGSDYRPSDLTKLECKTADNREMYLRKDAATALTAMMLAMEADGISDVSVTSAYRAYSRQKELFEGYVAKHMAEGMTKEEATAAALEYSAQPGTSEHQTGLCIDFITSTAGLSKAFENTAVFRWLSENAYKFGFILRYPEDKVDITGYTYEPWHYRFVGRTAATEIYSSGLCFEEYLELN